LHGQRAPVLARGKPLQVLRELAHQVAARDPHRQRYPLLQRGLVDAECDAEKMRMQAGGFHPVVDACAARQ
jgi:hypothetical protein